MKIITQSARIIKDRVQSCEIECEVKKGSGIYIEGMLDIRAKESLLRVLTGLQACRYKIPNKEIDIRIEGGRSFINSYSELLDLPIALSILAASEQVVGLEQRAFDGFYILGELGLDGSVRRCSNGVEFAELAGSNDNGGRAVIMPARSAMEAWDKFGNRIYAVKNLSEAVDVVQRRGDEYLLWNTDIFNEALGKALENSRREVAIPDWCKIYGER